MEPSLKSKAAELRREHILAAALRVFAERGYRRATIRDIAAEAGVADGTIYNVFANKAELMIGLIQPLPTRDTGDPSRIAPARDPGGAKLFRDRWEGLTPEVIKRLRVVMSEALVDADLRPLVYERIIAPVVEPLHRALAMRHEPGALDPAVASRFIVATVFGLALLRMLGDKEIEKSWAEVPEQLANLFSSVLQPRRDC